MINKAIVKEIDVCKCRRLAYLLVNDKPYIRLAKLLEEHDNDYDEITKEKIYELLNENKNYYEEIEENIIDNLSLTNKLILDMKDYDEVSDLSRRYYAKLYKGKVKRADTVDGELDGTQLLSNSQIEKNTIKLLNDPDVKVIFEGQLTYKEKYLARWDILVKNDKALDLIELKAANNNDKIKREYLIDLAFQYYIFKNVLPNMGFYLNSVNFMLLNKDFFLENEDDTYPLKDEYLEFYFAPLINHYYKKPLVTYLETLIKPIEGILTFIDESINDKTSLDSKMQYACKKCLFFNECHQRCNYPEKHSIFSLNNSNSYGGDYKKSIKLIETYEIKGLNEISDDLQNELFDKYYKPNKISLPYLQIEASKNRLDYIINTKKVNELLDDSYQNYPLIFFDFETFMYPIPIINKQKPYEQICTQYSMHVVRKDYDLFKHDFELGTGGGITHYEFIGNPRIDLANNPEINLIETLIKQLKQEQVNIEKGEFTLIVYNKQFEQGRFKNMASKYPKYNNFLMTCYERTVDLMEFFQNGFIYLPTFNGKVSLKVVTPSLINNEYVKEYYKSMPYDLIESMDYHSQDYIIHNGSEALDAYQTLIRASLTDNVSDELHDRIINGLLTYCKKDSWNTVVIFDIINKLANLK